MAAVDFFLKIDGIDGESADDKHKGEIELESWSISAHQSGGHSSGGGGGAGKVLLEDYHFTKRIDKASPTLFLACCDGRHIKKAVLTCRKAGKTALEYLKITLSDLLVSSYQTGGSAGSTVVPVDQISLNYSKIEKEYKEQKPDGTLGAGVKVGFDIGANKKV